VVLSASGDSRFGKANHKTNTKHEDDKNYFNGNQGSIGSGGMREFERAGWDQAGRSGTRGTRIRGTDGFNHGDSRHQLR
jgi:hypothetical protein